MTLSATNANVMPPDLGNPPKCCLSLAMVILAFAGTATAQPKLFARYDWADGARDVAGAAVRHDGALEPGASIVGGKLVLNGWDGVTFGEMPELIGAKQLMIRFEDVTIDQFAPEGTDPASHYAALAGGGSNWWVGVHYNIRPNASTTLQFVGLGSSWDWGWVSQTTTITHFDSIDFKIDVTMPPGQQYGIRWNDGPWILGGEANGDTSEWAVVPFRINDGAPSDWEPIYATLGTVSLYSDVVVPEPASCLLLTMAGIGLGMRRPRRP